MDSLTRLLVVKAELGINKHSVSLLKIVESKLLHLLMRFKRICFKINIKIFGVKLFSFLDKLTFLGVYLRSWEESFTSIKSTLVLWDIEHLLSELRCTLKIWSHRVTVMGRRWTVLLLQIIKLLLPKNLLGMRSGLRAWSGPHELLNFLPVSSV
jgi:hypothetical protein